MNYLSVQSRTVLILIRLTCSITILQIIKRCGTDATEGKTYFKFLSHKVRIYNKIGLK